VRARPREAGVRIIEGGAVKRTLEREGE